MVAFCCYRPDAEMPRNIIAAPTIVNVCRSEQGNEEYRSVLKIPYFIIYTSDILFSIKEINSSIQNIKKAVDFYINLKNYKGYSSGNFIVKKTTNTKVFTPNRQTKIQEIFSCIVLIIIYITMNASQETIIYFESIFNPSTGNLNSVYVLFKGWLFCPG